MLNWVDTNPTLGRLLASISTFLAGRRGLPMLAGTVLTVISAVVTVLVMLVIVSSDAVDSIWLLMCLPAGLLHLAIFLGFIGFMMATPLGQSHENN